MMPLIEISSSFWTEESGEILYSQSLILLPPQNLSVRQFCGSCPHELSLIKYWPKMWYFFDSSGLILHWRWHPEFSRFSRNWLLVTLHPTSVDWSWVMRVLSKNMTWSRCWVWSVSMQQLVTTNPTFDRNYPIQWSYIGWQKLNLLSQANATLAPQVRQARQSGEILNYSLSRESDLTS